MPDGWENRQIVFIVRVEAKQQFLSEIPYVGAILAVISFGSYIYPILMTVHLRPSPSFCE